jgi:hypothetical protein
MKFNYALLAVAAALLALALACSGDGAKPEAPAASPSPEPTERTLTPDGENAAGTITAFLDAVCRLLDGRYDIVVAYRARSTGDARVGRVRLFVDDAILEDTGLISERQHADQEIIPASAGARHQLRVEATPDGSASRASVQALVECPGPTPGPRA